jgi:hypothetical protein
MRRGGLAALVLAGGIAAQAGEPARLELARTEAALQQNRAEVERLLDLRMQHDLGLPVDRDQVQFRTEGPVATEVLEWQRQALRVEEQATATLLQRYGALQATAEQLQAKAAAEARRRSEPQDEWITVPKPGSAAAGPAGRAAGPEGAGPAAAAAPHAPADHGAVRVVQNLGPVRSHIDGSEDHSRIAQALCRAALALMDRAAELRRLEQAAAAAELDAQARERLQRALDELKPMVAGPNAAFVDLFCLGRCREALFRLAERHDDLDLADRTKDWQRREQEVREPFLSIAARDVTVRNGVEQPGPWARAARTAMEHFRWMNLNAGFRPKSAVESITWPGAPAR